MASIGSSKVTAGFWREVLDCDKPRGWMEPTNSSLNVCDEAIQRWMEQIRHGHRTISIQTVGMDPETPHEQLPRRQQRPFKGIVIRIKVSCRRTSETRLLLCSRGAQEEFWNSGGKVTVYTKLSPVLRELVNQDQGVQREDTSIITLCAMHAVSCHGLDTGWFERMVQYQLNHQARWRTRSTSLSPTSRSTAISSERDAETATLLSSPST